MAVVLLATRPTSLADFIWLSPGTTRRIYDFYASNLRGSFFTGFLALGGFLMSAKTFIIVNMKKEVYDSAAIKQYYFLHNCILLYCFNSAAYNRTI